MHENIVLKKTFAELVNVFFSCVLSIPWRRVPEGRWYYSIFIIRYPTPIWV